MNVQERRTRFVQTSPPDARDRAARALRAALAARAAPPAPRAGPTEARQEDETVTREGGAPA